MSRSPLKNAAEYAAFRLLLNLVRVLPERLALALGAGLGWFVGSVLRIRRRAVAEHLRLAFPNESEAWRRRVADASYRHMGRETVAIFKLSRLSTAELRERTTLPGLDEMRDALAEGRGVILMTGHLGNWEVGAAGFTSRGVPLDAVAKGMENSHFGRALLEARDRLGMGVIDMDDASREVLSSLRAGRVVAILADQNAHRGGVFVPFFGKLAATVRGPALFALRSGAPMFIGIPLRDPGWPTTYTISIHRIEYEATGDRERDVLGLTEAHTRALEGAVRSAPEQYFWQHKRWKKRPESELAAGRA